MDRESVLVFAITLALFVVGTCSMIGMRQCSGWLVSLPEMPSLGTTCSGWKYGTILNSYL
jgi:hypothetical protein